MTALADLLRPADCRRLFEHPDEANELDRLMRTRGPLAGPEEPEPLHRVAALPTERTTA